MKEQLRMLGIYMALPGTEIMEAFIDKTKNPKDLTEEQVRQVLYAWDTRYIVPINKREYVDRVLPEENLNEEEYEKRYVELIYKYLQTI